MSAAMASCAARFTSAGAGKSGKPCDKLIALYCNARRVISRITDSVNCSALTDKRELPAAAGPGLAGFILSTIESAINIRVAGNDLHVLARFGEGNRFDELRGLAVVLPRGPRLDAILACIIRSQRGFYIAKLLLQAGDVDGAKMHVVIRVEQPRVGIAEFRLFGEAARRRRKKLHQAEGVGRRMSLRRKCG